MADFQKSGSREPFLWNRAAVAAGRNRKALSSADSILAKSAGIVNSPHAPIPRFRQKQRRGQCGPVRNAGRLRAELHAHSGLPAAGGEKIRQEPAARGCGKAAEVSAGSFPANCGRAGRCRYIRGQAQLDRGASAPRGPSPACSAKPSGYSTAPRRPPRSRQAPRDFPSNAVTAPFPGPAAGKKEGGPPSPLQVTPPSRSWRDSSACRCRSPAGGPHSKRKAAGAPRPKRAGAPCGSQER